MTMQNRKKRQRKNKRVLVAKQAPVRNPMRLLHRPEELPPAAISRLPAHNGLISSGGSHHTDALSRNQRQKIVMMGRLVQKDGKLTKRQQEQIREIFSFAYALGYHP